MCATEGVTPSAVARTFSLRDAQTSRMSLHLAFSTLMFHPPPLLFSDGHFDEHFSSPTPLSSLSWPKIAGHAHSHTSGEEIIYMAASSTPTGYEPQLLDKNNSVDDDMTSINDPEHDSIAELSKTTREGTDCSVFPRCENTPQFRTFLLVMLLYRKKVSHGKPCADGESKRKEKVLWLVVESRCQGKADETV